MPILATRGAASASGFGFSIKPPVSRVYATLNPSDNGGLTLTNGNLTATSASSSLLLCRATISKSAGYWYWEITYGAVNGAQIDGICTSGESLTNYLGADSLGWGFSQADTGMVHAGAVTQSPLTVPSTAGTVIGVALNLTANTLQFYWNNATLGTAISIPAGTYYPAVNINGTGGSLTTNFGASAFSYTVPTGANAGVY